jgi:hypothetical protein
MVATSNVRLVPFLKSLLLCRYGVVSLDDNMGKPLKVLTNVQYNNDNNDADLVVKTNWRYPS